jgi:hypothetical protein
MGPITFSWFLVIIISSCPDLPDQPSHWPRITAAHPPCTLPNADQCTARRSTQRILSLGKIIAHVMAPSHLGRVTGAYHLPRTLRVPSSMQPYPMHPSLHTPPKSSPCTALTSLNLSPATRPGNLNLPGASHHPLQVNNTTHVPQKLTRLNFAIPTRVDFKCDPSQSRELLMSSSYRTH